MTEKAIISYLIMVIGTIIMDYSLLCTSFIILYVMPKFTKRNLIINAQDDQISIKMIVKGDFLSFADAHR